MSDLSTNIRLALAMRGWSQYRLATESGLHPSRVSTIITERVDPRLSEVQGIAQALQVPITWLLEPPSRTSHILEVWAR